MGDRKGEENWRKTARSWGKEHGLHAVHSLERVLRLSATFSLNFALLYSTFVLYYGIYSGQKQEIVYSILYYGVLFLAELNRI